MPTESNETLVRRYIDEVWTQRNVDSVEDILSEDFVGYGPGPFEMRGIDSVVHFTDFMSAMAELTGDATPYVIESLVASGDEVAVRITQQHLIKNELQLFPSDIIRAERERETGMFVMDEVRVSALALFRIREGKITAQWLESNYTPFWAMERSPAKGGGGHEFDI